MHKTLKYIRINGKLIVFPDSLVHAEVANGREVESAGFINSKFQVCYGGSMSLGVESDPERDTALLRADKFLTMEDAA